MRCDVAVIGGGNAALCAALAARASGRSVAVLERAPRAWRGGDSKYTRNLRSVGDGRMPRQGSYTNQEFFDDLERVAEGEPFDRALVELLVRESANAVAWMETLGVRWQSALEGTLQLAHTNWFFLGGGKR